jgi:transcriptional regulator GlxA family with amidase domain
LLWHRLARRAASQLEVEETALAIMGAAIAAGRGGPPPRCPPHDASRRGEIVRATQLTIASRPAEPWPLATLAGLVGSSPFHLARAFRDAVAMPIHQYLLLARLTRALDGVLDSDRSLSAVGLDAGFAHHSHFTATFHRVFGVTPSQLRRNATATQATGARRLLGAARLSPGRAPAASSSPP